MSSDDLFAQEMGKVQPLNAEKKRAQAKKTNQKHNILNNLEHQEVVHQQVSKNDKLSVQRTENWLLQAAGVASKDIKKLAQNHIKHELDLHGLTQAEAILALKDFVTEALGHNIRQISIVHGRGNHSKGKSVLKEITYQWLEHSEFSSSILAAIPATQSRGGACNILLRKQSL